MALLEIVKYPAEGLKKPSSPVEKIDDSIRKLVSDMIETMYDAPGVGLAAPQVGVNKRVIVADASDDDGEKSGPLIIINPEIVSKEGDTVFEEGCLSVPDFTAEVDRAERVRVRGEDGEGNPVDIETGGLLAIVLQHEIDHLDGILFVDRIGSVKRDIFKRKFKKASRQAG